MIIIDQLRITDDGTALYLDAHVNQASYFDNVYIDKVTILTEGQVSELDPLSFGDDYIYQYSADDSTKEIHLVLNVNSFNENFTKSDMTENMFFVYISCKGTPASDTPCRLDEMTTLAVTFDYGLIFNNAMCFTKEMSDSCSVPMGFIDFILNYEALRIAIETEHYVSAIEHFNWLKNNGCASNGTVTKGCGCHS